MRIDNSSYHVILSGCSGGGKSTLLAELADRGFQTIAEPGRRIVVEELGGDGAALPWVNLAAFATRAIELAAQDRRIAIEKNEWTFFDRGVVDAAVALQYATGRATSVTLADFPPLSSARLSDSSLAGNLCPRSGAPARYGRSDRRI